MKPVKMRNPKNKAERLEAALLSEDKDLIPSEDGRIYVTGLNISGERIYLGDIEQGAFYSNPTNAYRMVQRIRAG